MVRRCWVLAAAVVVLTLWLMWNRDSPRAALVTPPAISNAFEPLFRQPPPPAPISVLLLLQQSELLFFSSCLAALARAIPSGQSVQLLLYDTQAEHPTKPLAPRQSAIMRTLSRFPGLGSAGVANIRPASSWGAAVNDAIPRLTGLTLLTLTDTIELEPNSLTALTQLLHQNPAAALVGGLLQDTEQRVHHAGYVLKQHGEQVQFAWNRPVGASNVQLPVANLRGLPMWRAKHVTSATATALDGALVRVDHLRQLSRSPAATDVSAELAQVMLSLELRAGVRTTPQSDDDQEPAPDWLKPSQTYSARAHLRQLQLRRRAPHIQREVAKPLAAIPILSSEVVGTMVGPASQQLSLSFDHAHKFSAVLKKLIGTSPEALEAVQPSGGLGEQRPSINVTVVIELECDAADETTEAVAWVKAMTDLQLRCVLVRFKNGDADRCTNQLKSWGFDGYVLGELQRMNSMFSCEPSDPVVLVLGRSPQEYEAAKKQIEPAAQWVVGRTAFFTDTVPKEWVEPCVGGAADEFWTPTQFHREAMVHAGVNESLVHLMPPMLDLEELKPRSLNSLAVMKLPKQRGFNLLAARPQPSGWNGDDRGNLHGLLSAFSKAFSSADDVAIYIEVQGEEERKDVVAQALKAWRHTGKVHVCNSFVGVALKRGEQVGVPAAVELLEGPIGSTASIQLVQQVQLVVSPSRGEQWALPVLQAMALGRPVIGTNWSGVQEHLSALNGFLLPVERLEQAPGMPNDTHWAVPNNTQLAAMMRHSFVAQDQTRVLGERARMSVVKGWARDLVQKRLLYRLEEILKQVELRKAQAAAKEAEQKAKEAEKRAEQEEWDKLHVTIKLVEWNPTPLLQAPSERPAFAWQAATPSLQPTWPWQKAQQAVVQSWQPHVAPVAVTRATPKRVPRAVVAPEGQHSALYDQLLALAGSCADTTIGEFVYETSNRWGAQHSLGIWNMWEPSTDPAGTPHQLYTDGDSCAASDRQAAVTIICGTEFKVSGVAEPSTCSYTFNLETAAACEMSPGEVDKIQQAMSKLSADFNVALNASSTNSSAGYLEDVTMINDWVTLPYI